MAIAATELAKIEQETVFELAVPISKMFVAERDQPGGYARPSNDGVSPSSRQSSTLTQSA